jgi:menaquinone-specific isochorismate synthase
MSGSDDRPTAVRSELEPGHPIDPFRLAGERGFLFHAAGRVLVGLGSALTIELPGGLDDTEEQRRATELLRAVPCDDHLEGDLPLAAVVGFGSFPFDRTAPARLVVPEVLYGSEPDGREWVTVVRTAGANLPPSAVGQRGDLLERSAPSSTTVPGSARLQVEPRSSETAFVSMVTDAIAAIDRGEVNKVVLARQVDAHTDEPIDIVHLLRRWHTLEPDCTIFSMPTPEGQFVGASPELLIERDGTRFRSQPLAGTAERSAGLGVSALPAELLESEKDAVEHRLVVDAIETVLRPLCSELSLPSRPQLVRLRSIVHLGTPMSGVLTRRPDGTVPTALELVGMLHPTPAVGGVPTTPALAIIDRLESDSRGHYAGPVGYVDAAGNGRWDLGIRAMTVNGRTARVAAGVGVVTGSIPEIEFAETAVKLTAVLDALDDPVLQVH